MDQFEVIKNLHDNAVIAKRKKDNQMFVIESTQFVGLSHQAKEKLIERINTLIQLTRFEPNAARYHNAFTEDTTLYVPYEYVSDVTLEAKFKEAMKTKTPMSENFIWEVVTNVALALVSFHTSKNPTGHGNISSKNIHFDANGKIKLSNFLLLTDKIPDEELIDRDLYQLGALIYEMGTLSKFDLKSRHLSDHLSHLSSGMQRVIMQLTTKGSEEPMTITTLLSVPEIAVLVLEKKLAAEKENYEETKRRVIELEAEIELRKKRKMQREAAHPSVAQPL